MILYRLAKQIEERNRLARSIRDADGDIGSLLSEKAEIEHQLFAQAQAWREQAWREADRSLHVLGAQGD